MRFLNSAIVTSASHGRHRMKSRVEDMHGHLGYCKLQIVSAIPFRTSKVHFLLIFCLPYLQCAVFCSVKAKVRRNDSIMQFILFAHVRSFSLTGLDGADCLGCSGLSIKVSPNLPQYFSNPPRSAFLRHIYLSTTILRLSQCSSPPSSSPPSSSCKALSPHLPLEPPML